MAGKTTKKKGGALGRGLGNLLDSVEVKSSDSSKEGIIQIDISRIKPNPDNPRKKFEQTAIKELADTIREFGLLQPILVRPENDYFIVISGERRLRACRLLKLKQIPGLVKEIEDKENIEISLIENIQREQLDPIEEGEVYKKLMGEYGMTQEDVAQRVGKNRSTIANRVRLLQLPENIKAALADQRLTEGQIRPILAIENESVQNKLASEILKNQLTARQAEDLAKNYKPAKPAKKQSPKKGEKEADKLAQELGEHFQTRVVIRHDDRKKKGTILIDYFNLEELDRILQTMGMDKKVL